MKNLFLLAAFLLALTSCKKESIEEGLADENKAVYDMLWGRDFTEEGVANYIKFGMDGDKIEFYGKKDGEWQDLSFEVEKVEDYYTGAGDLASGHGVKFIGEGYSVKTYLKDGTTNYVFVYCYFGSTELMGTIIAP